MLSQPRWLSFTVQVGLSCSCDHQAERGLYSSGDGINTRKYDQPWILILNPSYISSNCTFTERNHNMKLIKGRKLKPRLGKYTHLCIHMYVYRYTHTHTYICRERGKNILHLLNMLNCNANEIVQNWGSYPALIQ